MKTAIIGLPMVGKTSLFTILTGVHESTRVGLMEARVGMTKVPDARLTALAKIFEPPKITQATVEYLDFPAVSKEALRDPSYLASMRVADALAHVLRLFQSETVPHEKGSVDPLRDLEDVEMELILIGSSRCWNAARLRWSRTSRSGRWSFRPTKKSSSAASNSCRRNRCCLC